MILFKTYKLQLYAGYFIMKRKLFLIAAMMVAILFSDHVLAETTNSCDGVTISFDQQTFTAQVQKTSLTAAAKTVKTNGGTAQEIICAALNMESITTADIITALRNAGFDPVVIRLAARNTGLDMEEVDIILAPDQSTPAPLSTSVGLSPGKTASPNKP